MKIDDAQLLKEIRKEIVLSMGCTEPGATAFGAASAAKLLDGKITDVSCTVSNGIYKNGSMALIPGTGMRGLKVAAALGAVIAKPEKELMVLEGAGESDLAQMRELLRADRVSVKPVKEDMGPIYVETIIRDDRGNAAKSVIRHDHNNLVLLEKNNRSVMRKSPDVTADKGSVISGLALDDLIAFSRQIPLSELAFIRESIKVNDNIAQYGITHAKGLGIGNTMWQMIEAGIYPEDLVNYACMLTTAAIDVRMGGCNMPSMACGGSGNQGILATLPILAAARLRNIGEPMLLRSLALSYAITIYAKASLGKLSVLCGCSTTAGTGSTAGITMLLGGDENQIKSAIGNFYAGISGMVCDGAKEGCSFKVMQAVFAAIHSAAFALRGKKASEENGIVGVTQEETIQNLKKLSQEGMREADKVIIGILERK